MWGGLLEFGAVILVGAAFVIFGQRAIDGRIELTARGQTAENSTAESWTAFHRKAGDGMKKGGALMVATSIVLWIAWAFVRDIGVVAANWIIAAVWIIGIVFVTTRAISIVESSDPRYPHGRS